MGLSEYTLRYLLTVKAYLQRKNPKYIGGVTYHQVDVKGKPEKNINDKLNMLEDLGVQVNRVSAPSYFDGYMMIADQISPKVRKAKK
jgi:transposase